MVGKKVNGRFVQKFLYSGQLHPIAELDSNDQVVSRFYQGYMVKGGRTYRLITDHLGSIRMVVDISDGSIAQRIDYDAWGNILYDSNPGFQPFSYAGGLFDILTKLTRFGARDYESYTGRWTAKDPIQFLSFSPNLFVYSSNDPIDFCDIYGLTNGPASGYHTSENGINFIAGFEGFSSKPYNDIAGKATIGYGHLIKPGESFTQITRDEALQLLKNDVRIAEDAVSRFVKTDLTQNQFDALVSFTYNLGGRNFSKSSLLKDINSNQNSKIVSDFLKWNKARINGTLSPVRGLTRRRTAEAELYCK